MIKINNNKSGFTLVELLVVVSIIALLSSIVLTSLGAGRQRGINSQITQQMQQMRNAIELYRTNTGSYPNTLTDLMPTYIKSVTNTYLGANYSYSSTTNAFSCGGSVPAAYIIYTPSYPTGTAAGMSSMLKLTYSGTGGINCSAGAGATCILLADTYCVANR